MRKINRFFIYIILIPIYCVATIVYFKISHLLPFREILPNAVVVFSFTNIFIAFIYLRMNVIVNILVAILIGWLSLFLAFKMTEFYYPSSDAYGIKTTIISNILFSIMFWEIAHQIIKKMHRT